MRSGASASGSHDPRWRAGAAPGAPPRVGPTHREWGTAMTLKQRLQGTGIVTAPGVYDAFSALLLEQAGFQAAYLSGASIAYTRLGRPDIGFLSLDDVASVARNIRERCPTLPLIVDADTGFGNALNVMQTVRVLERAGATAIQ